MIRGSTGWLLGGCLGALGCGAAPSDSGEEKGATEETTLPAAPLTVGGERSVEVRRPADFDPSETLPAVIVLHGYGVQAAVQDAVFGLGPQVDEARFLLLLPQGTTDGAGYPFWNAWPECCNFFGSSVDDVAWLSGVVEELRAGYRVSTVTFVGHSNGGYMGYRLLCDAPEVVDRLVVLAGSGPVSWPSCKAEGQPRPVLHIHGTADDTIAYGEADGAVPTAGAVATVSAVASLLGCGGAPSPAGEPADLVSLVDGAESTAQAWADCPAPVQLWTVEGGDHLFLSTTPTFRTGVRRFATEPEAVFP